MTHIQPDDSSLSKLDPRDWKTGDEPMTAAQRSYLETLSREAGEDLPAEETLTKAEAALRIEKLQKRTGRGNAASTRNHYRDRPTDDGMHGDGDADPSGVGDERNT